MSLSLHLKSRHANFYLHIHGIKVPLRSDNSRLYVPKIWHFVFPTTYPSMTKQ